MIEYSYTTLLPTCQTGGIYAIFILHIHVCSQEIWGGYD